MPGGSRSPYRPPCGYSADDPEIFWLGYPHQHFRDSENGIAKYKNTTAVPNYQDPSCPTYAGANIPPYSRLNTDFSDCQTSDTNSGHGTDCDIFCGPWPDPPFDGYTDNAYAPYDPAETVNLATCRKIGFKNVIARKAWHGRYGFTTQTDQCCTPTDDDCCSHPESDSPPTTKYRTLSWSITATVRNHSGAASSTTVTTLSGSCTVDRYSGVVSYSDIIAKAVENLDTGGETDVCTTNLCTLENDCFGTIDADSLANALLSAVNAFCVNPVSQSFDGSGTPNDDIIAATGAYANGTLVWTADETSYSRVFTDVNSGDDSTDWMDYSISATLSDPYTSDDLNDDLDDLLAEWHLDNDTQLPWRTDLNCTSGPLVTWLEYGPNIPTSSFCATADTSSVATALAAYGVTSKLLGAPNPAGYDQYFDFRHITWQQVADETCPDCWRPMLYGASAPPWAPYATQWTDEMDAASLPAGAFRQYNHFSEGLTCCGPDVTYFQGYLVGNKYAEVVLLGAPSHDFARPCSAKDAETIDQDLLSPPCTTLPPSGTLRWPDAPVPCPAPPDSGGEWNDNTPKGDWCLYECKFNFRDIGEDTRIRSVNPDPLTELNVCEYNPDLPIIRPITGPLYEMNCTQHCSQFIPCCPAVVYISNNAESSANSQTFTIPKLGCDDTYGALWQEVIQQWMTDPLWQPPKPPCGWDGAWLEDDGSGQSDTDDTRYYPQRPWEEARCSLPDGAPALPDGTYIGCLNVADQNDSVAGNTCSPPSPGICYIPWWFYAINRANTIAGAGRFACEYADPLAVCDDDPEIEPP